MAGPLRIPSDRRNQTTNTLAVKLSPWRGASPLRRTMVTSMRGPQHRGDFRPGARRQIDRPEALAAQWCAVARPARTAPRPFSGTFCRRAHRAGVKAGTIGLSSYS
jgi:hypothetical protein